jgi:hypothetical protein
MSLEDFNRRRKTMYCPVCSTESSNDQKFCRSCGADLQIVLQALNGQLRPLQPEDEIKERKKKLIKKGGLITWIGFMIAFTFAVIGAAANNINYNLGTFFMLLSAIGHPIVLTGAVMMGYARFFLKVPSERNITTALPESPSIASLPIPLASITENTTELLEASRASVRGRDTAPQNN